jgi:hypothetical protein
VRELDSQQWLDNPQVPTEHQFPRLDSQPLPLASSYLISTQDLLAQDATDFDVYALTNLLHGGSPSGRYLPNRGLPTSTGFAASDKRKQPFLQSREQRLAPDSQGVDIPPSAMWTRIKRSLVSPQVLQRAGVRYEARPEFVAVLGILSREQIMEYSRQSAEIRQARRKTLRDRPVGYKTASGSISPRAGSTTEEDPDPWDLDLQAWDSDLDAWNLKRRDSEGSDSSDVLRDSGSEDEETNDRAAKDLPKTRFADTPTIIPDRTRQTPIATTNVEHKSILRNKDGQLNFGSTQRRLGDSDDFKEPGSSSTGTTGNKHRRRRSLTRELRERRYYRREQERDRSRDRDGDRDRDRDVRVAQKKSALKDTLGAVGIGAAAATLLSVLSEAADYL